MPSKKQKNKKTTGKISQTQLVYMLAIMVIMAGTATAYSREFVRQITPVVLGEEDSKDEVEVKDDEEKDEVKDESDENEAAKKEAENVREAAKQKAEKVREQNKRGVVLTKTGEQKVKQDEEDGNEVDEADENDTQGKIQELQGKIDKIEAKMNAVSNSGTSYAALTTALADAKSLLAEAQAKAATDANGAEQLAELAEKKLERVEKIIKLVVGDTDEDENGDEAEESNDANEAVAKLSKEIAKVETKLTTLAAAGTDVAAQKTSLEAIKATLAEANAQIAAGDLAGGEVTAKIALKKLEVLKDSLEEVFEGTDENEDAAKTYKNSVAQFVHNLKEVADLEGGIGQQVRVVAQAQNDAQPKIENAMSKIEGRGKFAKFLVGPDYSSLKEVESAIATNQNNINALKTALATVNDPTVKLILQDQITFFEGQNQKLQNFVTQSGGGVSLFGWLARIFS